MCEWRVILNHKDTNVRNITYQPWLQQKNSTFQVEDTLRRTNVLEFTLQVSLTMITRILGPFYQVIHVVQNQHTREQEGNLEKTTKKNTILNDVSSLFLLSQCVPSSLAWRFCTTRTAKRLIQVMIWPIPRAGTKKQMVTSYGLSKRSGFSRLVHLFTSTSFNSRSNN